MLLVCFTAMSNRAVAQQGTRAAKKYVLVIHGGAGTILKKSMTPDKEEAYRSALSQSLKAGYDVLKAGGKSMDAVVAAIHVMEDSPLFNAGKGAVFTNEGTNELDASIMDGKTRAAGAVAGVAMVKHPISAAKAVMEKSGHVMLSGKGADAFARSVGLEIVDPSYFWTKARWDALQRVLLRDSSKTELDHSGNKQGYMPTVENKDEKFGTVGAVALDADGNLAAGTSTGGMTNKKFGRIGDSPVIGAGTYANGQVAISCTGWGEYYIRSVAAYDVAALMEYKGLPAKEAGETTMRKIGDLGGDGGMIILDKDGNMAMPFNTEGMYRAAITDTGDVEVAFYK